MSKLMRHRLFSLFGLLTLGLLRFFLQELPMGSIDPCVECEWVFHTQRTSYHICFI